MHTLNERMSAMRPIYEPNLNLANSYFEPLHTMDDHDIWKAKLIGAAVPEPVGTLYRIATMSPAHRHRVNYCDGHLYVFAKSAGHASEILFDATGTEVETWIPGQGWRTR